MKDILLKKRRLEEYETIALTEECSAIIQNKLPHKLKDPGSFTILGTIGDAVFERALCDLEASINLMPLSIFRRLGLGEAKPTTVTLQLADRSLKHPRRIIEDVLVKVEKFIFTANFIFLDLEEDKEIPMILGRPFLAIGRALIDVQKEELRLRVQDEEVRFSVFRVIRHPAESESFYHIENIEAIMSNHEDANDPLNTSLLQVDPLELDDETKTYVQLMNSFEENRKKYYEPLGESVNKLIPSIKKAP